MIYQVTNNNFAKAQAAQVGSGAKLNKRYEKVAFVVTMIGILLLGVGVVALTLMITTIPLAIAISLASAGAATACVGIGLAIKNLVNKTNLVLSAPVHLLEAAIQAPKKEKFQPTLDRIPEETELDLEDREVDEKLALYWSLSAEAEFQHALLEEAVLAEGEEDLGILTGPGELWSLSWCPDHNGCKKQWVTGGSLEKSDCFWRQAH